MDRKKIGKKIRQKRQLLGYSTEQMANLCHINEGYLKQIETGSKLPAMPLLITLCELLQTSPNYLFEFTEDTEVHEIIDTCYKFTPRELRTLKYLINAYMEFQNSENLLETN